MAFEASFGVSTVLLALREASTARFLVPGCYRATDHQWAAHPENRLSSSF